MIRQMAAPAPVLILLLAAQTVGLQQAYQGAIEDLTPVILALCGVALVIPAGVAARKTAPARVPWQPAALALALLVAGSFAVIAWHSRVHLISFNLWLLLLRPLVLMLVVMAALRADSIPHLIRGLFYCTGALAVPMLGVYLLGPLGLHDALLRAGLTTLDVGGMTRLQGFAADPNFFGLWLAFGLFAGMGAYRSSQHKRLTLFFLAAIAACLVCTLSRGALLATAIALLATLPWSGISPARIKKGAVVAGLLSIVALIPLLGQGNPLELAADRLARPNADRIALWTALAEDVSAAPHGLGSAHALLGKTGHNTYLETAYEAGIGGLALWLAFVGLVTWRAWEQRRLPERRAWLQMWVAMLVMMAFFSLLYHSSFWVIAGVILSFGQHQE